MVEGGWLGIVPHCCGVMVAIKPFSQGNRVVNGRLGGVSGTGVDVVPGYAGPPELQVLGGGVHARSALLELPAGADVAVNLCHAGSIRLWNSPRKGKVSLK